LRRFVVILCVLALASIVIAARAATIGLQVQDLSSNSCGKPILVVTSTTSLTTTTTTTTPLGCQTAVLCASKADNHDHNNDNVCDGNNGKGDNK
jgi:hypothetical protein